MIGLNLERLNPSKPLTDEQLVAAARAGDRDAFARLVRRHENQVFTMALRLLCNREDARDLAQEVFLTVYQSLDRFRGEAQFRTWLYRVTINRGRDEIRRRGTVKHTRPVSLDRMMGGDEERAALMEPASRDPSPEAVARGHEAERMVQAAMGQLSEELREVIVLRDVRDLAYDEMAQILEIPVGTVRSRLNRARTRLSELLQPMLEGEA
jgi:RNA polymerase sigma-70 factor (ECF subfamily)